MSMYRAALVPLTLLLAGCGTLFGKGDPDPVGDPLSRALVAMEASRFEAAERELRPLAASCPGGQGEVETLLLLSVLHLDPRYDGRNPAASARYAARAVRHPDVTAVDLEVARALYLASRDLGAPPLEGPPAEGESAMAGVEGAAGGLPSPCPAEVDRRLPSHPGPVLAASVARARAALDSVGARPGGQVVRRVEVPVEGVSPEEQRLRERVQSLEAELARIRKLLGGGG